VRFLAGGVRPREKKIEQVSKKNNTSLLFLGRFKASVNLNVIITIVIVIVIIVVGFP
jgi:hypothetical protein